MDQNTVKRKIATALAVCLQQFNTAKRPAVFEEQHRAELTAYRAAAAYFKANSLSALQTL